MAGKRMTKAQIVSELADRSGLSKKDINGVLESLRDVIKRELGAHGPGEFVVPELALKLKVREVQAQKGKKFRNPATGEIIMATPGGGFIPPMPSSVKRPTWAASMMLLSGGIRSITSRFSNSSKRQDRVMSRTPLSRQRWK